MSLLDVLRTGVAIADQVTKPLQSTVSFSRAVVADDSYKTVSYPVTVPLRAIVDWKKTQMRTSTGTVSAIRPNLVFLDIAALVAATSGAGLSDLDKIVLQDGTTGPTLNLSGFIDAGTGHPIATECAIG